jgi:hypothetical protein
LAFYSRDISMAVGKKTGGRVAGTPNRTTAQVKEAILKAFDQVGGPAYLKRIAEEDPKTFCTLLGKVLPTEITGPEGSPVGVTFLMNYTGKQDSKV